MRSSWENRLFNNVYNKSNDHDRVKYGVLNIVNDPSGVKSCVGYGDSYLVLNNDTVRFRCSFASCDTGGANAVLATCEHYNHVMMSYND